MKTLVAFTAIILLQVNVLNKHLMAQEPTSAKPLPGLVANWIGQNMLEPLDLTNRSAAVGPDGFEDIQIELRGLIIDSEIESIDIETVGGGQRWAYGNNPQLSWNAEVVRTPARGPTALLAISVPVRDTVTFAGKLLKIKLKYQSGVSSEATVVAGKVEPDMAMPVPSLPIIQQSQAQAIWVGPVSGSKAGPGAVRIEISGLNDIHQIRTITVTEPSGTLFFASLGRGQNISTQARDLVVESLDQSRFRLDFLPNRDLNGQAISICMTSADNSLQLLSLSGGRTDPGRQIPDVGSKVSNANPSMDLQLLADKGGTIELANGVYKLHRPLVLRKPVRIIAAGNARPVLRFSSNDHQFWSSALRICSSGISLEGFDITCDKNIDWNTEIAGGPAIITSTNTTDQPGQIQQLLTGIRLSRLKISSNAIIEKGDKNESTEAVRLIRMNNVSQGAIESTVFQGGGISITGGPWVIRQNRFDGPPEGSYVNELISAHRVFDFVLESNRVEPLPKSGEVRKFLNLSGQATNVRVGGNLVRNVGLKELVETKADSNYPIFESGSRRIKFEGEPIYISPEGTMVVLPQLLDESPAAGDVLAILSAEKAGSYHVVRQHLGKGAMIIDPPLTASEHAINPPAVSLSSGFKQVVIYKNTIEARSPDSTHISIKGNHFGTILMENLLENGGESLSIASPPTESPMNPGWTHAPIFGLVIHGNRTRDPGQPIHLSVAAGKNVKTSENRVYYTGQFNYNQLALPPSGHPVMVGDSEKADPGQLILLMTGNQTGNVTADIKVNSGTINGKILKQITIPLTTIEPIQTTDNRQLKR